MHEVLKKPGRSASQDRHELTAAILLNPLHGAAVAEPRPVAAYRVGVPSFRVLLLTPSMTLKLLARGRPTVSLVANFETSAVDASGYTRPNGLATNHGAVDGTNAIVRRLAGQRATWEHAG